MLHRAGLCGVLLCWVVFVLSVSGSKKSDQYDFTYYCLHKHVCDCDFGSEYEPCFYQLPEAAIDGFEKLAHQKLPQISNVKQSLDTVWSVLCKEPKEVFFPFFVEAYDDLKAYTKKTKGTTAEQRRAESIQLQRAKLCANPLVSRCLATKDEDCL
ncbi:hypothetical protein JTE90_024137 [Oedothorax gibbosus]|uniref:Uncharacterized protein n=1 Tax=Oedothorax gibbosus TaxID=931172 RepID=A0AAV6U5Z3_9ARAC|nr:hypothetical protein JTE90_024137 [Oedothorax gibbosus]